MKYPTTCPSCGKEWTPKRWFNFFEFCGVCRKKMMDSFEEQFPKKRLRLEVKK